MGYFINYFYGDFVSYWEYYFVIRLWFLFGFGDSDCVVGCRFFWRKKIVGGGGVIEKRFFFRIVFECSCLWLGIYIGNFRDCR